MKKFKRPWDLLLSVLSVLIFLVQTSSGEYVEQFLESVEVCTSAAVGPFSTFAKKKIRLQNYPNNTVMVKLTRWDDFWPSFMNFRCKFQVVAGKGQGVMVVIQGMHLRTKQRDSNECRDWIKFEQKDGFKAGPICGELSEKDFAKQPKNILGPRYFYDNGGVTDVSFSTDDHDKEEKSKPIYLKMIFTAYQNCDEKLVSSGKLRRCSSLRSQSCIPANLFCDGELNCGFNDSEFGSDEANCDGSSNGKSTIKVMENSTSFFVFTLICFFTLIAVVVLLCFVSCCFRRFTARSNRYPPDMEFSLPTTGTSLSVITNSEAIVKQPEDKPPSYHDLFPGQSPDETDSPKKQ